MPGILALILLAIVATVGTASAQPINIGLSGPMGGDAAAVGLSLLGGARLAVAEINEAGGILGRKITLIDRDDEANPAVGEKVAQSLIGTEHVVATIGFASNDVALAAQKYYQEAAIPVFNAAAASSEISRQFAPPRARANYIFQMAASTSVAAAVMVREAVKTLKVQAPAIIADDAGCSHGDSADLQAALKAAGLVPSATPTFSPGATDLTPQLYRLKLANADLILVCGQPADLAQIANGMAVLGWKLPIMGGEALASLAFLNKAGANGEGAMMPQTFIPTGNTERRAHFVAAFESTYKVNRIPSPDAAAQAYDSVLLLKAAIEQAKSTDGPQIRAALENLATKVEGVITTYDHPFSPDDHEALDANIPLMAIVHGGWVVAAHEADIRSENALRQKRR